MAYTKQSEIVRHIHGVNRYNNSLDNLLFDIHFTAYPQDDFNFSDVVSDSCFVPVMFFSFEGNLDFGVQQLVFSDKQNRLSFVYCNSFAPESYVLERSRKCNFIRCFTYLNIKRAFLFALQSAAQSQYDWSSCYVRIGSMSQFKHIELSLSFHHYRFYVSYYGFLFGDEYDDRLFIHHVRCKTKSHDEAVYEFKRLLFDFISWCSYEL